MTPAHSETPLPASAAQRDAAGASPRRRVARGGSILGLAVALTLELSGQPRRVPLEVPSVVDERLQVTLYADAPEIMTPIGAAVDARGRLFVLESHTHLAPKDYAGPKRDLIKIFSGENADGRAAQVKVFADDVLEGMNLAFAPDGTLYVITAKTVEALRDRNGDDRLDAREVILRLETEEQYPHNQLLGLTISRDGWLYASRGNTGGHPHAWVGADGTRLEGYGNGGDVVRCRLDGSRLERFATGFWNPFDLKFDRFGRLIAVDNDPDSRGPNRLLHLVAGGDYGFKSLYGASGLHPYSAWEGELPGTLPMIAGIGESPSGVLDLSQAALPAEYRDTYLATIWAEHTIPLYRPTRVGTSLRASTEPFIRGGRWFRPVALVAAPDGAVFITDWVLKDYPNHQQGRIWKLAAKPGVATRVPIALFAEPAPDPGMARLERLSRLGAEHADELRAAIRDEDPFVRHAALSAMSRPEHLTWVRQELASGDAERRLGALLALRRAEVADARELVRPLLSDPDPDVRKMALIWTGERELRELLPEVDAAVDLTPLTPRLFETWLATLQILQTPPPVAGAKRVRGFQIPRDLDPGLLNRVVADERRSAAVRTFALRRLVGPQLAGQRERLRRLADGGEAALRTEAIRSLAVDADDATRKLLEKIATDRREDPQLRAEAIAALGPASGDALRPLLGDGAPEVRTQAARTLRVGSSDPLESARPAPEAAGAWVRLLAKGGRADAGERVFFAPSSTCAQCHRIEGRGGVIGPDLSVIGRTADRERLIRSIVTPSEEIAPQFQGWEVKTRGGDVLTGIQGHLRTGGGASIILLDGREVRLPGSDVADFRALEQSLMPEGLAALFTVEELRDLVAYLESRK